MVESIVVATVSVVNADAVDLSSGRPLKATTLGLAVSSVTFWVRLFVFERVFRIVFFS